VEAWTGWGTAAAITENSGQVLMPAMDVGPQGRMCIAMDPTGAAFGVWQAGNHIGAGLVNEPGGLAWEDLRSPDPDAARTFYQAVFGFTTQPLEMAGPTYHTFHQPGEQAPLGGMGGMMGADDARPHWLVYFSVADARAAQQAAIDNGGTVVQEHFDSPFGQMAGLLDPAGALFWIVQVAPGQPQPDRTG
jgi:predicted enzyme related to lactoylglutathione lyase